jgi:hypothetical protein
MSTGAKHVPIYLGTIVVCYFVAWTVAFLFLNGPDFAFYFEYLGYFWKSGGGERPMLTGMFSIALTIPLAMLAIWILRRGVKKKNEESA